MCPQSLPLYVDRPPHPPIPNHPFVTRFQKVSCVLTRAIVKSLPDWTKRFGILSDDFKFRQTRSLVSTIIYCTIRKVHFLLPVVPKKNKTMYKAVNSAYFLSLLFLLHISLTIKILIGAEVSA